MLMSMPLEAAETDPESKTRTERVINMIDDWEKRSVIAVDVKELR